MSVTRRHHMASTQAARPPRTSRLSAVIAGGIGLLMLVLGIWSFVDPASFAAFARFSEHTHYLHDIGAFQIGIGVTLVLALIWDDSLSVALGGFVVGNTLHVTSHLMDLHLGGRATDWLVLAALSALALVALAARRRQVWTARDSATP